MSQCARDGLLSVICSRDRGVAIWSGGTYLTPAFPW